MSAGPQVADPAQANAPALALAHTDTIHPNDTTPSSPTHSGREDAELEKSSMNGNGDKNLRGDVDEDEYGRVQEGVRQMRAITQTWTKKSLSVAYILMWLIYFVRAFSGSVTGNLGVFVTSDFGSHSLIPLIAIVADVMSAALYMPIAKGLNLFDRSYGFLFLSFLALVGHIMSAACKNVETYAAAQVFTSVGLTGMILSIDILTADTSRLRDRGLAYAYTSSPYIITTFAGSKIAEHFHETDWRWAFGIVCILIPVVAVPMFGLLQYNKKRAIEMGVLVPAEKDVSLRRVWDYVIEFDLLGVFLLAGGLALFLIPFNIAYDAPQGWNSDYIIAMLVVGLVLLLAFGASQISPRICPKPVIPFNLLISRSVLGACLLSVTYNISNYCYASYFGSFLQVVYDTSVSQAGYITGTWDIVSGVWLLVVGYLIRRTNHFKWLLLVCIPIYMLGSGLLIYFRQPGFSVGYMVMCQIFLAIGGATCIVCQQVAVLSVSSHNNAAAVLGLLGVFGNIGGSVGSAISGAIWTHTFPDYLQQLLPAETADMWQDIYGDLDIQLSYPMGDPTRDAIIQAYAKTQRIMLIAATCVMALCLGWSLMIKNVNLAKVNQTKGTLF